MVLAASQRRVEPFWHVACTAHYAYDRTRMYSVPASAGDLWGTDFDLDFMFGGAEYDLFFPGTGIGVPCVLFDW